MMLQTRRTVLRHLLLLLGCVTAACSSSESTGPDGGQYYFRFRANGDQIAFTLQSSLLATFSNSGTQYVGIMTGYDATSSAHAQVYDGAAIATDTYSGYAIVGSSLRGVLIGYEDPAGVLYTSGSGQVNATVQITELTATSVRGVFSGTLRATGHPDLIVTQGEFFVPRFN